ncbi:carboxylesterase [Nocardiopsis dassonvillei]|nr:carboxylesterase family protein [Nocardiopsis dassonvillei]ASU58184.1 carboxylesterase [Nocardiopsis dassonvillei]
MRRVSTPAGYGEVDRADLAVATHSGTVLGRTEDNVHVFRGIPYAMPPRGPLRFQPPRPVEPWTGVRKTVEFGPTAAQPSFALPAGLDEFYPTVDGNGCLNLNVWTADLGHAGLPVMVWIHGGGFDGGGSSIYDGSRFARDGVVLVSVNYRLGAEGFLALGDGTANLGLLDQIAALEWVRDNIAAFGGDPGNVTVFGQSSGAMCAATLLAMPAASGLFRRAILQSGAGNFVQTPETARHVGQLLAEALGVQPTQEAIASASPALLLEAQMDLMPQLALRPDPRRWNGEPGARVTAWQPVVDGRTLPGRPIDLVRAGASANVDVLLGTNTEEGRLSLVPSGELEAVTEKDLATAMRLYELPAERASAIYRRGAPGAGPGDILALLQRDWWYRAPAYRLAEARAVSGVPVHMYEFAWRSPRFDGLLGACHFLEVPFVFDVLDDPRFQALTGEEPPQSLADTMHASWIAFATHGDPGWPHYDLRERTVMRFDTFASPVRDPWSAERELWDGID